MNLREIADFALAEACDSMPKNETLEEHKKHCRAKGECPFEKSADLSDDISNSGTDHPKGPTVLLAPNGNPSNLTERQWHQVRTPEFKAWFGDWENDPANASKVVDENGEPRVMFHGSDDVRTEFKMQPGMGGVGAYFTSAFPEAADYVREKIGDTELSEDECEGYVTECFLNVRDEGSFWCSHYGFGEIIVKASEPTQIKSATENSGSFSRTSGDIRDEATGKIEEYLQAVEDAEVPKNETLSEHRKHCEAQQGNCPFEKSADTPDEISGENGGLSKCNAEVSGEQCYDADGNAIEMRVNEEANHSHRKPIWVERKSVDSVGKVEETDVFRAHPTIGVMNSLNQFSSYVAPVNGHHVVIPSTGQVWVHKSDDGVKVERDERDIGFWGHYRDGQSTAVFNDSLKAIKKLSDDGMFMQSYGCEYSEDEKGNGRLLFSKK